MQQKYFSVKKSLQNFAGVIQKFFVLLHFDVNAEIKRMFELQN